MASSPTLLAIAIFLTIIAALTEGSGIVNDVDTIRSQERNLQGQNPRVTAYAYLCNDQDQEITNPDPIKVGDIVRICVQPERPSQNRGVVMQSIDEFIFRGSANGYTQPSIANKKEEYWTLVLCIPGQLICAFKVQIQEELFWSYGSGLNEITGAGTATLEFKDTSFALGGVAGAGIAFNLNITIQTESPPPGIELDEDPDAGNFWTNAPLWFRILIIVMGVVIICCICGLCFSGFYVLKDVADEDKARKKRREREEAYAKYQQEQAYGKYD